MFFDYSGRYPSSEEVKNAEHRAGIRLCDLVPKAMRNAVEPRLVVKNESQWAAEYERAMEVCRREPHYGLDLSFNTAWLDYINVVMLAADNDTDLTHIVTLIGLIEMSTCDHEWCKQKLNERWNATTEDLLLSDDAYARFKELKLHIRGTRPFVITTIEDGELRIEPAIKRIVVPPAEKLPIVGGGGV